MLSKFYRCSLNYVLSPGILSVLLLCGCQEDEAFVRCGYRLYERKQYNKAIESFDAALSINGSNTYAYFFRGNSWAEKKDASRALKDYNQAIEIDPNFSHAYHGRAYLWAEIGNNSNALADYTKAIELNPSMVAAYINRANPFAQMAQTNRAIDDYTAILSMAPKDRKILHTRGDMLLSLGRISEALRDYSKVIKITPNDSVAYSSRADAWYQSNEYAKAICDLTKAIELHVNGPETYSNLAWLLSTCPDNKLRDGKRALEIAQKAWTIVSLPAWQQYLPHVYSTIAAAYAENGNYEMAVQCQSKAIELARKDKNITDIGEWEVHLKLYREKKPLRVNGLGLLINTDEYNGGSVSCTNVTNISGQP